MMNSKTIDLSNFKKGVTLDVDFGFANKVNPFLIFITDPGEEIMYYYRKVDRSKISINLPEHTDQVTIYSEKYPVKTVLISPLRICKMKYCFNNGIVQQRPYSFNEIKEELLPVIAAPKFYNGQIVGYSYDQPARFLPSAGLIQYNAKVLSTFPQPTRMFIRGHEKGHYYYGRPVPPPSVLQRLSPAEQDHWKKISEEDEREADRYALYSVTNDGYNFSGSLESLTDFLSDNYISKERMKYLYNIINQEHKNPANNWS